jgi:hypothetical protein
VEKRGVSVRRGYWFLTADGVFDGPFKTIKETKEAASKIPPSVVSKSPLTERLWCVPVRSGTRTVELGYGSLKKETCRN